MIKEQHNTQRDWDLFEYVIALNCTTNDIYLASVIDVLKLAYIKNNDIQQYLSVIFEFYRQHKCLPNTTEIKTYLINDVIKTAYKNVVTSFKTLDTQYNHDELLKNTEQYIRERAVFEAIKKTVNEYSTPNEIRNPSETLQLFEKACNITLVDNIGFDYFNKIDEHISNINVVEQVIPTGYKWLDKMLGGGWQQNGRALYLFNGASNVGKSIVLGNIGTKLLEQNRAVCILSLEMSEMVYSKRISSQLTRLPINRLKEESIQLQKQLEDFRSKHSNAKLIIKEFPPSSITANNIKAYLKKLISTTRFKPEVLIVDYLTLLLATIQSGSMYSDGKAISEQIRALSYPQNFGIPIISAAQISRSGYQEANPDLDKTGESMGIVHTADAIFTLWQSDSEKELGILNCGIKKNRFGLNFGKQAFRIDYDTLAIDEMDEIFSNTTEIQSLDNTLSRLTR